MDVDGKTPMWIIGRNLRVSVPGIQTRVQLRQVGEGFAKLELHLGTWIRTYMHIYVYTLYIYGYIYANGKWW